MPSWLPHILIPTLVALVLLPMPRRTLLAWAPMAWAPDLDYLIQSQHRAITHSVFIPMLLLALVVARWRALDPSARFIEHATRPGWSGSMLLAGYFLASHSLMDVFAGGVVLFWPITDTNFFLGYELILDTGNNTFTPAAEGGTEEGAPELAPLYPWISYVDTAILAFLAAVAVVWGGMRLATRRRRGPGPVEVKREARAVAAPPGSPGTGMPASKGDDSRNPSARQKSRRP